MICLLLASSPLGHAAEPVGATVLEPDQGLPGAGNARAETLAKNSPLVQSAYQLLIEEAKRIKDDDLREQTLDLIDRPASCVRSRMHLSAADKRHILAALKAAKLVDEADDASFPGGLLSGVFPALKDDETDCPKLPQPFFSAPGSYWGGHHSEPGGLMVHEAFNDRSAIALALNYQRIYGGTDREGLPIVRDQAVNGGDLPIDMDLVIAAPLWHDWAKTFVFQWTAKGDEFKELNFGGNGHDDDGGQRGDSKTAAHHLLGIAEAMARHLSPAFVITQASAHAAPTNGNEFKVVNWLRTAAILARIDPVAAGYLMQDHGQLRLPEVRALRSQDFAGSAAHVNMLAEYEIHNLSDADFSFTMPVVHQVESLLQRLAPEFGYDANDVARYNWDYRNPTLSYLSSERIFMIYSQEGLGGVRHLLVRLHQQGII